MPGSTNFANFIKASTFKETKEKGTPSKKSSKESSTEGIFDITRGRANTFQKSHFKFMSPKAPVESILSRNRDKSISIYKHEDENDQGLGTPKVQKSLKLPRVPQRLSSVVRVGNQSLENVFSTFENKNQSL